MIDESDKSPMIVLTTIIVTLLAYNILTIRDKHREEKNNSPYEITQAADSSDGAEYVYDRGFLHVVRHTGMQAIRSSRHPLGN